MKFGRKSGKIQFWQHYASPEVYISSLCGLEFDQSGAICAGKSHLTDMPRNEEIPMTQEIVEGKKAPAFTMPTDGSGSVSLKDFSGKKLVMFFYPKDNTPGCTTESLEFSENLSKFRRAGADVLGVSRDSVASHDKFKLKQGLKITLASDADTNVIDTYGSWVEKNNYGRKYMGIERSTFLIDESGKIIKIWRKVRVKDHVADVLAAVKELKE